MKKKRKETALGYLHKDWVIKSGDFGMIFLPIPNMVKRQGCVELTRITIEEA